MRTRDNDKASKLVSKLCCQGEIVIESEKFKGVNYLVKKRHIAILAGKDGELAIEMSAVPEFVFELSEIHNVWKGIN